MLLLLPAVTYTFAGDVLSSVTTRTWDFSDPDNPVVGAAGTSTNVLQGKAAGILTLLADLLRLSHRYRHL